MLGRAGQVRGIDLRRPGPTITICQSRARGGDAREQLEVDALVDHAEEAEPRVRDAGLVRRVERRRRAAAKCAASTLLGNAVHVGVRARLAS